jgi:hypothetical protein
VRYLRDVAAINQLFTTARRKFHSLFEQSVVDIDMGEGNGLARVNGYVHSMMAGENRPDSNTLKIVIRFVDNDADKFEVLSKFIAQM